MSTIAGGRSARREPGSWKLARIITTIARAIAAIIVVGILLIVLEADQSNGFVSTLTDVAKFFVEPFRGIFDLDDRKATVAVNWGLGALIYLAVAHLIARLLAR